MKPGQTASFLLFAVAYFTCYYGWILMCPHPYWKAFGSDLFSAIFAASSALWLYAASRRSPERDDRTFWLLLSLGSLCSSVADFIWFYYEAVLFVPVPHPGAPDICYLLQMLLYLAAFGYKLYKHSGSFHIVRFLFDILIVMTVATAFSWHYIIEPLYSRSDASFWVVLINTAYPIGDLGLLFAAASLYFASGLLFSRRVFPVLLAGLLIQVFADSGYLYLTTVERYVSGSWMDPLWAVSLFLIALSGTIPDKTAQAPSVTGDPRSIPQITAYRILIPYACVIVLFMVLILENSKINSITIGASIALSLIIIRQVTILLENDSLLLKLQRMNEQLGHKVNQRTKELLIKNDMLESALKRLEHLAYHDALTGLPNRRLFEDRLTVGLAHAKRNKTMIAVLFIDLDRFKNVNDYLGHHIADQLLQLASARFKRCLREVDTVSRQGGDEFTILLEGLSSKDDAAKVIRKLQAAFEKPFHLDNHELFVSLSIGAAFYPSDGTDIETLMKNADQAMYDSKRRGRNTHTFYRAGMGIGEIPKKVQLEADLRKALELGQLQLHYQPQVDLSSGRIVGAEALLRWKHPVLGLLTPSQFIPLAEETGLILPIGRWVLQTACMHNMQLLSEGYPPIRVSVNLSPRQFLHESFVESVSDVLDKTGLDPSFLDLEITENIAMHDVEHVVAKLCELKKLGVRLSIDDFGTGYSSLSSLTKYPIDTLKIDKSFIETVRSPADDTEIIRTIIAMARNLKCRVIAEGIETEFQYELLRSLHCDEAQGYWMSRPLPFYKLIEMFPVWRRTALTHS